MIAAVVALFLLDWWLENVLRLPRFRGRFVVLGIPTAAVLALLILKATGELEYLSSASGRILPISAVAGALALGILPFWRQFVGFPVNAPIVTALLGIIVIVIFAEQMVRRTPLEALRNVACTFLAVFYLGVGGAMVMQIRVSLGLPALALFLGIVKLTDMAAYFAGSAFGRHKLVPSISPGKSWEGLAAGLAVAAGAGVLGVWLLAGVRGGEHLAIIPHWRAAVFGVAVGAAGQFADLCESLLKRSAGVKDSAAAVPEFGGVLDIIDSVLLSAPVAYLLMAFALPT